MSKHIRTFESFRGKRRNINSINETVIQRDSSFIVGGVKVDKKTISAYAKKVKDQTGKDLKSMYSEMEIAEELVKWSVNSLDNIDNVPVSALMGGEEEMAQELDDIDTETDVDETGETDEMGDVGMEDIDDDMGKSDDDGLDLEDDSAGDDDLNLDLEDDEFESPEGEESGEDDLESDNLEDDEEDDDLDLEDDEEDELPI